MGALAQRKAAALFVTGDKFVDQALAEFDRKFQRKTAKVASKKAIREIVQPAYVATIPVASGALKAVASKAGATKLASKRNFKGQKRVGHQLVIDDKKLYKEYKRRTGKEPMIDGRNFFYPVTIELGNSEQPGSHEMVKALKGQKNIIGFTWRREIQKQIREAGRSAKGQKDSGFANQFLHGQF